MVLQLLNLISITFLYAVRDSECIHCSVTQCHGILARLAYLDQVSGSNVSVSGVPFKPRSAFTAFVIILVRIFIFSSLCLSVSGVHNACWCRCLQQTKVCFQKTFSKNHVQNFSFSHYTDSVLQQLIDN